MWMNALVTISSAAFTGLLFGHVVSQWGWVPVLQTLGAAFFLAFTIVSLRRTFAYEKYVRGTNDVDS